jgi:hypothetical protein
MACGVGIVKAQPGICSWHLTPSLAVVPVVQYLAPQPDYPRRGAGAADRGVRYAHQVVDLPEAPTQTTWYDRHEVRCACGRAQRDACAGKPRGCQAPRTTGTA